MSDYIGSDIQDAYLAGNPSHATLILSTTSPGKIYYQLILGGASNDSKSSICYGYNLRIGTTIEGGELVSVGNTWDSGKNLRNHSTLASGTINYSGTVYTIFNAYIAKNDEDHLSKGAGTYDPSSSTKSSNTVKIECFGLEEGTTTSLFATWSFGKSNVSGYNCVWSYTPDYNHWFDSKETVTDRISKYTIPSNAKNIRFTVTPVSTTYTMYDQEIHYWVGSACAYQFYSVDKLPPSVPPVPTVSIDVYQLTAELTGLVTDDSANSLHAEYIEFQVVYDDYYVYDFGTSKINTGVATHVFSLKPGHKYKVCARSLKSPTLSNEKSDYSAYSSVIETAPGPIPTFIAMSADSSTSIHLTWTEAPSATSYDIEYATKLRSFDISGDTTKVTGIKATEYIITGLETGSDYFARVRATNAQGSSAWTEIKSVTLGKAPSVPTTWSSSTTVVVGGDLYLYWIHNSKDGSSQTYAELEINGVVQTIKNSTSEETKDKTSSYKVDTTALTEGAQIKWRVRTAGVMSTTYGDWSVLRVVDIYASPTLALSVIRKDGTPITELTAFPFYIQGIPGPASQTPTSYYVSITANESYETVDDIGTSKTVNEGDEVYAKYFSASTELLIEMSASNIDLQNNISYTITVTVSMNSGLTANSSKTFTVSWTDATYYPNAEIGINPDSASAYICPYCVDENDVLATGVTLGVYRREFDGSFVEIAKGISNTKYKFVTDPHPSLDLARYRIVATVTATGAVSFFDVPGVPTNEHGAIIQWNEDWSDFETDTDNLPSKPGWSGSMIRLLYNVDVKDDNSIDSSLVEYIGRKHPVSYYGTQVGSTSSWSMDVPKSDKEMIYQLRRLAIWPGDVYVREPSGTGYWALLKVSFELTHCVDLVPVTLDITRVEGGI